jgi:hypothetical protein
MTALHVYVPGGCLFPSADRSIAPEKSRRKATAAATDFQLSLIFTLSVNVSSA